MPAKIGGNKKVRWFQRKAVAEAMGSVPPLVVAAIGAYRLLQDPATEPLGWASAAAAVWLLGAFCLKTIQAVDQDKKIAPEFQHEGISGAICVVHAAASHACGLDIASGLKNIRVTFHRLVLPEDDSEPTQYEQLIDYVGRDGGGRDRRFSVALGITGRAFRADGDAILAKRKNADIAAYEKELINDWGYSAGEAKKLKREPMAWLAVPIRDSDTDKTIGIVYLDSTVASDFDTPGSQEGILTACLGVTRYVGQRYGA